MQRLGLQPVAERGLRVLPGGPAQVVVGRDVPEEPPLVVDLALRGRIRVVGADQRDPGLVGDGDEAMQLGGVADRPRRDHHRRGDHQQRHARAPATRRRAHTANPSGSISRIAF